MKENSFINRHRKGVTTLGNKILVFLLLTLLILLGVMVWMNFSTFTLMATSMKDFLYGKVIPYLLGAATMFFAGLIASKRKK